MKGPADKNFEGIYANPRFMHAAGIIVGCVVHVQVKSGSLYEGVLRTFSSKADFVLEMARKLDSKKVPPPGAFSNTAFSSIKNTDEVLEKIVFKFEDVIMMTASNVDPDFATRETFTDTAISRSNGQILERELEPWDAGTISSDGLPDLGGSEEANGWDPNDMFRTNEEKYGVKSSFDSNLPGYTIPLNKQNTEEYKQQEAKATQIAQEIESGPRHKARSALDNGDEELKYSAVIRPDSSNNNNNNNSFTRVTSMKNKRPPNMYRNYRGNPSPGPHHGNRNSHQHSQVQVYQRVSSPAVTVNNSQGNYKMVNAPSGQICVSNMSPRPTPTSTPTSRSPAVPLSQMPQYHQGNMANSAGNVPMPPNATVPKEAESVKINGDADKTELKFSPKPPRTLNLQSAACKEGNAVVSSQIGNKSIERRKEVEKKAMGQKNRDEKTEDLKRFHAQFKLADEKDVREDKDSVPKSDAQSSASSPPLVPQSNKEKHEDRKSMSRSDSASSPDTPKSSSTLNPNAKEFVFNPNAKSFTPRAVAPPNAMVPPPVQPPPRLHTQSPIMAMPQSHLMPGIAQTVFNVAPHYVVSTTPLSVPVAPPFNPASIAQAPRLRKNPDYGLDMGHNQYEDVIFSAMPMSLQRHDMSQPMHVQAATGQPILAQPTLSAPQFTIQYAPSPGVIHHPPGPPQQLAYAQMYSLMPRVLAPHQTVGMVPTSAAYGDNPQIQTHIYMPHQGTPGMQHAMNSANAGQHSAPSTPQSQTPNLHPAPSPVHHQQPPPGQSHGQPPTPNGLPGNASTPQQMVYHSHMAAQHSMHGGHTPSNQGHPFAGSYAGTPQPIVLLPQQPHHGPHSMNFASTLQNHLHGQTPGSHSGTPTHILAHPSMAMIPTSAAMVHTTPTAMNGSHYVPHSQV